MKNHSAYMILKQEEMKKMKRVQDIYRHPYFQTCLEYNRKAEESRVFCRHDMGHFMDVARLAYVFSMERGYPMDKEEIYAAALLHDIGKWRQYSEGIPHEQASAGIAEEILTDAGYEKEEKERILTAILNHRRKTQVQLSAKTKSDLLSEVLYDADKISRACYVCPAEPECNWNREKKNLEILW
ncbi:HD domain-containing protein [Faecalicatena contorta]|uniref:HD domain-containing protein n=1 Tax=Faecalicatena contorta TaxID=39482 RepID=UPI001F3E10A3|nr:HD domain-containing protein [Faecalicatena contorta]